MLKENCCILSVMLVFSFSGYAQSELAGRVTKRGSTEILIGVNIANGTQKKYNVSDMGGNYKVPAAIGDSIFFTYVGYRPDTIIVQSYMLDESFLVPLTPHVVALSTVVVDEIINYQNDSIKRRDAYAFLYDKKHPVKLMNEKRQEDAPGLNFSPIGYFSTDEKQKRKFKQRLEWEEENAYIDYKFPITRVSQLTRLEGDSLHMFMLRYRPSYQFCRSASSKDIFLYINEKFKLFMKNDN